MNSRKKNLLPICFFLVLSSIWVAPGLLNFKGFLFHPNAKFSDVLISHWPNMYFIRDALQTWKAFPLWNPLILSGAPLVGDPLFGIWYFPNWLSCLLPIEIAYNILFWLHLAWAGWGMFQWMRSEGFHWGGALIAGIAFSGMPKLIGHIGLGHLSLVSSIAWTPWLLLSVRRMVFSLSSPERDSVRWFALGGGVTAILFMADPRWIIPSAALAILYAIRTMVHYKPRYHLFSSIGILSMIVGCMIFVGTISGLAIPMVEFTLNSTRVELSLEEITDLSLPIENLIGALIPQYGAWPETIVFAGLIVLGLAVIALLGRAKGWVFWLGIASGSLLLALGNQTPLYPILLKLIPGLNILRVPARISIIGFFSLFTLAGAGLDLFLRNNTTHETGRWIRLGLVGVGSSFLLLGIGSVLLLKDRDVDHILPYLQMITGTILIVALGFYSMKGNVDKRVLIALWIIPVFLDLFLINRSLLEIRAKEELFKERSIVAALTGADSSWERIFSPSYSIPQHVAAVDNLQLADGVNPLQLQGYWEYMAQAVGFDPEGYSVTLPPFPDGDPSAPLYTEIDTVALGRLNVVYIVSEYPIDSESLVELEEIEGTYIYRNSDARPRAWIESKPEEEEDEWHAVESIDWSPNLISIKAQGEGLLILSEQNYPGWEAFVNGKKVSIVSYKGILRSVPLEHGENLVEFHYRPWSVYIGTFMTFLTLLILGYLWWRR
ncbi:MAG: hypothetical protein A2Z14_09240 [Chloroflexi bacterium RBG_16_48_8]|nr:MAG: hypothetical protein A2Z14_09240 [Chloroflexi bacterium RBG_16_48_8]